MREDRLRDDKTLDLLRMMAPGTHLREGLENILRARTGALIVIGDSQEVMDITDGGFFINKEYSPAHLYELAKMDGAIILSKDLKKIIYANALLIPDPSIPTEETGTRHKSAERAAKQTKELVICISQRRNIITLYRASEKYILRDTPSILTRANQALHTLEKYKAVLDTAMNNLNVLEFEDIVTLDDVAVVLQRIEMVMRIVDEIDRYVCELGNEGRLTKMQLEELIVSMGDDGILVIEDYMNVEAHKKSDAIMEEIRLLSYGDLMDLSHIYKALGYSGSSNSSEANISPRGYRLMGKIPRVPFSVVKKLLDNFTNLQGIIKASLEELHDVEGIGTVRAKTIKGGLRRLREQCLLENRQF